MLSQVLEVEDDITKPRIACHVRNAGSTPARMIEIISPAGRKLFRTSPTKLKRVPRRCKTLPLMIGHYGLQFKDPPGYLI